MHRILEGYIKGEGHLDMTDLGQEAGTMAQALIDSGLERSLDEVWGMEMMMYYPGLYGGACDIAGLYEGKEAIIDFKQSNKFKNENGLMITLSNARLMPSLTTMFMGQRYNRE